MGGTNAGPGEFLHGEADPIGETGPREVAELRRQLRSFFADLTPRLG